jgi:Arc/MetJ-type ribon-helix-helix transcriptional regulator
MATLSIPISAGQEDFIKGLVKSGKAANKAHAVRLALDSYEKEEAIAAVLQAEQEIRDGKGLRGNLRTLASNL